MDAGINPTTGDLTGQRITTLANAVYLRLMTPLGSYWADPALGVFSLGYTRSAQFDRRTTEHVFASWNKSFRRADVALIADSQVGGMRGDRDATLEGRRRENTLDNALSVRLQVSVLLGGDRRVSSYTSRRGDQFTAGTALSESVNEYVNYEVGVERDLNARQQSVRGHVDLLPRYTRVGLGVSRDPLGTSYTGQLQGGVVVHESGLTFSPPRLISSLSRPVKVR